MHHWRPLSVPSIIRDFVIENDVPITSFNESLKVYEKLQEYKKSL